MKYLVILNANSIAGKLYLQGNNDGTVKENTTMHPVLHCIHIDMETYSPSYILLNRQSLKEEKLHQSILLPPHSIEMILEFFDEEDLADPGNDKLSIGFAKT